MIVFIRILAWFIIRIVILVLCLCKSGLRVPSLKSFQNGFIDLSEFDSRSIAVLIRCSSSLPMSLVHDHNLQVSFRRIELTALCFPYHCPTLIMSTIELVIWLPRIGELNQVIVEFVCSSGIELTRIEKILMARTWWCVLLISFQHQSH